MAASASNPVSRDGYYKGIKLAGKVKIVRNFGDIKIKVVNSFPTSASSSSMPSRAT